jgi:hypothetical protein
MKKIKKLLGIRTTIETVYGGQGYTQGTGFTLSQKVLTLGKIRIVTGIIFDIDSEWMRSLKRKIADDDVQQAREQVRNYLAKTED